MITIQRDGKHAVLDVRENIARGEHPKNEIFKFVNESPAGTILQIHVPFRAEPLIAGLSSLGLNVTVTELAPDHFQLMTVKLTEF